LVSFFVNGCELGATKSMSNPKIKLRTSIFFQQCISWANNIVLYHQDLIQKITSSQGRVNHHLFVCSNHFRNTCCSRGLQVYIGFYQTNPVESRLSISQTRLLLYQTVGYSAQIFFIQMKSIQFKMVVYVFISYFFHY
jgi:hypothetical protein